jgi:hypothetical protein
LLVPLPNTKGLPVTAIAFAVAPGLRQPAIVTLCVICGSGETNPMVPPPAKFPVLPKLIVCGPATPLACVMIARKEPGPVSYVVVTV